MLVETVSTQAGLEELAPEWDTLVRAMPRPSPFLLHGWISEWWRHYGNGGELCVHVARRNGKLVGALPLCIPQRTGVRVLEFIGGRHSALADLLLAEPADSAVARALAERAASSGHDVADFFGLPANSALAAALPAQKLRIIERVEAPVLDLSLGWDAVYRAKTDSKKRNLHKRRRRQLAELGPVERSCARTLEELEPALEHAFELHALRWEGRPDGSGFAGAEGQRFHRAALRRLAGLDVLRIVTLEVGGRPIAFHYFFSFCNRMYVHRLAFDPSLARYSPGVVNTLDALETASAEGLQLVEYLGGGERYKLELADRFEPLHEGLGLAETGVGRLSLALRFGAIRARRRLRRFERLHRLYLGGFGALAHVRREQRPRTAGE